MSTASGADDSKGIPFSQMEESKVIVARFFEIFSSGDSHALLDAMTEDSSWWVSGRLEGMSGRYDKASLGALIESAKGIYKTGRLAIRPTGIIAEGNKVAVEAEGYAELVDGRLFHPHYHFLVIVKNNKIHEVREYMDTQHAKEIFFPS